MTEREQKYVADCQLLLDKIQFMEGDNMAKAICVNSLSKHIRETLGMWTEPGLSSPDKMAFLVGLTFADLIQLQNGGTVEVNPKDVGLQDMPTTIYIVGTHEHAAKGLAKHPGTVYKFTDSHGDVKN